MTAPAINLPLTTGVSAPNSKPLAAGTDSRTSHICGDAQVQSAGVGTTLPADHGSTDVHRQCVGREHDSAAAIVRTPSPNAAALLPPYSLSDQGCLEAPTTPVAEGSTSASPTNENATPWGAPSGFADPTLALLSDVLDDLERTRIANENRLRQLTRTGEDADGEERGFGLDESHPDVARLAGVVEGIGALEHQATLNLNRAMRKHPLGPWAKAQRGVGEKQAARLLAAIGDPYWNTLHDRPRTVSELWAYSGYHVLRAGHGDSGSHARSASAGITGGDPGHSRIDTQAGGAGVAPARARGQQANWSADAKMRAYLVIQSCIKAGGPYREVYDEGRAKYADAIHHVECKRCGPSGEPALPGSLISAGHQHARATRLAAKALLRDMWREAKRIHEGGVS